MTTRCHLALEVRRMLLNEELNQKDPKEILAPIGAAPWETYRAKDTKLGRGHLPAELLRRAATSGITVDRGLGPRR
jgi:hypothetical protein